MNVPILPCPVDVALKPNESFDAAGLRFETMPAPGHCASMLFFFTKLDGRKVLIAGDSFCWGGKVTVFYFPDADRKIFRETLSRLKAERDFDAFLPGHRYPVMRGGKEHLDMAIQEINRQLAGQPAMKG
jgi:glyoxylase-like metal-dependent hydrolase (beta-lactamase superfamily II)